MKPVLQKKHGSDDGDCLMAAIASVLEIELAELPGIHKQNEDQWFGIASDAVRARGFRLVEFGNDPPVNPPGYAIALGASPRAGELTENHAVVALDGDVVHDPDPTRSGVEHIVYWLTFVPLARSPQRTSPDQIAMEI